MAIVKIPSLGRSLEVKEEKNLMKFLLSENLPVASSCNGEGICAKCKVLVLNHPEGLSPMGEREKFLIEKNKIPSNWRISCQCTVIGNVEIKTNYW